MLINIKTRHFHSSNDHQESLLHRALITSYFRLVNIAKFLRTAFLHTFRSSCLQMFFKIGVLKSFANFTGKHLCWSFFLKKLAGSRPATLLKKASTQGFSCEVSEILKTPFFIEHLRWLLLHLWWLLLYFFKKVIKQLSRKRVMTYK